VGVVGPPGPRGPEGRRGVAGEKGSVLAGLGLNAIEFRTNQFVQQRVVNLRRPVIIIEQPIFLFQKVK
jgi:hypothetical protein